MKSAGGSYWTAKETPGTFVRRSFVEHCMAAMREPVIHRDPEILGGTPVFVGTRVPAQALIDYLKGGHSLDEFLDDFPTVSRDQAIAALELARDTLVDQAPAA